MGRRKKRSFYARPPSGRICRAPGCGNPLLANALSPWCSKCRHRAERMGHPLQQMIWPRDYKPYLIEIKRGINQLPPELRQELELRVARRVAILESYCAGLLAPGSETDALGRNAMHRASAAFLLRAVRSQYTTAMELVLDTMARARHWEAHPTAYKSDRAFYTLAIHRLQVMAKQYVTIEWDGRRDSKYSRRRQRELAMGAATIAGGLWLNCVADLLPLMNQVATKHSRLSHDEAQKRNELKQKIADAQQRESYWTDAKRSKLSASMKKKWAEKRAAGIPWHTKRR